MEQEKLKKSNLKMKVKVILLVFILSLKSGYSQETDYVSKSIFLKLMDENALKIKDKKDGKLIQDISMIKIEIDTLEYYGADIVLCKFELGNNKITIDSNEIDLSFRMSNCNEYIWAYDFISKRTFKLKGFFGNDLLFLINTIKNRAYERKSTQKILKELTSLNVGLDFCRMYKALISLNFDDPILVVCSEGKISNSKNIN